MRLWGPALAFYGALSGIALGWGYLGGRPNLLWAENIAPGQLLLGLACGVLLGLGTVLVSRLLLGFRWARDLMAWFGEILGPLRWRDAAALAALSAIGEELLFRGAMQQQLGIGLASLAFALAHVPPRLRLWPWTLSAGIIGLLLGLCAHWTASLLAPITAHFLINLLNLMQACGRRNPAGQGLRDTRQGGR